MALKDMDLINNTKRKFDIPQDQKKKYFIDYINRVYNQILNDT